MSLNFAMRIKTQLSPIKFVSECNNSWRCSKNYSVLLFFLIIPILQLKYMYSRMFLPLYSIKRTGNIYRETFIIVLHNVITFSFPVLVFSLQSFVINHWYIDLNIAFWCTPDVFIDFKCGLKWNIVYLKLVIMKKM